MCFWYVIRLRDIALVLNIHLFSGRHFRGAAEPLYAALQLIGLLWNGMGASRLVKQLVADAPRGGGEASERTRPSGVVG